MSAWGEPQHGSSQVLTATKSRTAVAILVLVLAGCSLAPGSEDEQPAPTPPRAPPPSAAVDNGPPPTTTDITKRGTGQDRSLASAIPSTLPNRLADFPSQLNDPHEAILAVYPAQPCGEGWERESIFFLGTDLQWRELNLGDLGLPADAWIYSCDSYGAGALSPDGTMWAGPLGTDRMLLFDLRSSKLTTVRVPGGAAEPRWSEDGSAIAILNYTDGNRRDGRRARARPRTWLYDRGSRELIATAAMLGSTDVVNGQTGVVPTARATATALTRGADPGDFSLDTFTQDGTLVRSRPVPDAAIQGNSHLVAVQGNTAVIGNSPHRRSPGQVVVLRGDPLRSRFVLSFTDATGLYPGVVPADSDLWLFAEGGAIRGWLPRQRLIVNIAASPPVEPEITYAYPSVSVASQRFAHEARGPDDRYQVETAN